MKSDLRRAVRNLRTIMGITQTEFGALIGKTLATVQRYEGLVPPKGKVLVELSKLADQHSLPAMAALFRAAFDHEFGTTDQVRITGMEILFFANGNTAVCHDGKQQMHLQESWTTLFATWLESHGHNPADYRVTLPNGLRARFFPTPENQWRLGLGCE